MEQCNIVDVRILDKRLKGSCRPMQPAGAAGLDLQAACVDNIGAVAPGETLLLVPTGIAVLADPGIAPIVLPLGLRPGAQAHGIVLSNLVGSRFPSYRGQIFVSVWNRGRSSFPMNPWADCPVGGGAGGAGHPSAWSMSSYRAIRGGRLRQHQACDGEPRGNSARGSMWCFAVATKFSWGGNRPGSSMGCSALPGGIRRAGQAGHERRMQGDAREVGVPNSTRPRAALVGRGTSSLRQQPDRFLFEAREWSGVPICRPLKCDRLDAGSMWRPCRMQPCLTCGRRSRGKEGSSRG